MVGENLSFRYRHPLFALLILLAGVMGFVCLTWFKLNLSDLSILEMPEMLLLPLTDPGSSCFPHLQMMKKELISGSRYGVWQEYARFCQGLVCLSVTLQAWHWAERLRQRNVSALQEGVNLTRNAELGDLQWEINSFEKAWSVAGDSYTYRLFLYLRITQSSTLQTHCSCSTSLFFYLSVFL